MSALILCQLFVVAWSAWTPLAPLSTGVRRLSLTSTSYQHTVKDKDSLWQLLIGWLETQGLTMTASYRQLLIGWLEWQGLTMTASYRLTWKTRRIEQDIVSHFLWLLCVCVLIVYYCVAADLVLLWINVWLCCITTCKIKICKIRPFVWFLFLLLD